MNINTLNYSAGENIEYVKNNSLTLGDKYQTPEYKDALLSLSEQRDLAIDQIKESTQINLESLKNEMRIRRGENIKKLQEFLGIPADGISGPQTIRAIKKFQRENGLIADGIIGARTISVLQIQLGNQEKNQLSINRGENGVEVLEKNPLNPLKIKSGPYQVSKSGSTMCSLTARQNLAKLGVSDYLQGHAINLTRNLEGAGAPKLSGYQEIKLYLDSLDGNTYDLYPKTRNGHRAAAFLGKTPDGGTDYYVLDPYYTGKNTSPVLLSQYLQRNASKFRGIVVNPTSYSV